MAVRLRAHATHDGPWCSPVGVLAPTGLPVAHTGMQFVRIQGSRIVELWTEWNVLGQLQQLGAVPTPDFVAV